MASTVSTSTMSVSGLASGIDSKTLIEQLLYLDRAPARLAENNKSLAQNRLDAVKTMNTRLLSVSTALDDLKTGDGFEGRSATSSNTAVVAASAGSTAVAGSMTVSVKRLATAHQVASVGQTSATTTVAAGSLAFRLGSTPSGTPDIVITPTTNTMTGLAEAINAANQGITASVVNDGSGTPYRLLISSSKTGEANAITSMSGTGGFTDLVPDLSHMEEVTTGVDAEIRLGNATTGLKLNSASNTMDQAIPGVSLQLKAVGDNIDVTVSQDSDKALASVQALADAFNSAQTFYAANNTFNSTTKTSGALFNDYDLRSKIDDLEKQLSKTFTGQPSGYQSLADVGVKIGGDGKMTIDQATFDSKMAANPTAMTKLFSAASTAAYAPMETLTASVDGTMALKQSTLEERIKLLDERITKVDARLEQRKAYYQAKFLAMEKITAQIQSQGNSLTSFISGLNKSSS